MIKNRSRWWGSPILVILQAGALPASYIAALTVWVGWTEHFTIKQITEYSLLCRWPFHCCHIGALSIWLASSAGEKTVWYIHNNYKVWYIYTTTTKCDIYTTTTTAICYKGDQTILNVASAFSNFTLPFDAFSCCLSSNTNTIICVTQAQALKHNMTKST